ncbi:uncharacterized protein LOC131078571 [Cryptomeria japonica]|uniref:uncharacterized protein LOC131078571 n=1 Tax=Cryptomeria japonica TaxID=3369 RepID=UPI0027DA8DC4|nr:uncharacterized protein LOC131078571 [Cryptomeria japonica]
MVELFGNDTFDKTKLLEKADTYLKYVKDQYRTHLEKNVKYERPPMIPEREWKDLILDAKERIERKKGNTLVDAKRRLSDTSKATKARQEKHGQHKLDFGGYMKLATQIGSEFNTASTEDDKRIAYQQGYIVVDERLQELSGQHKILVHPSRSNDNNAHEIGMQPANHETQPTHEGPDVHPNSGEHVVGGDQVEHDPNTQHQECDVPN